MAVSLTFSQDTGAATGGHGTTRTTNRTDQNWKNIDDSTTAYSSAPVVAGQNAFGVYQYAVMAGTWNSISNVLWSHTATAFPSGVSVKGKVTSTYLAPSTTAISGATDMSTPTVISSGTAVTLSMTDPSDASPVTSVSGGGTAFSSYLLTQLQTTGSAGPGDISSTTWTLQWDES